ncbi:MAG: MarR family winged helix-turn-helix transcriptional regulator [Candidatus Dormibacteraceae bacterium]
MTNDSSPSSDGIDLDIVRIVWQAENAIDRALDRALAPLGLTTTMQGTLRLIADQPGISAADLARSARVRPQTIAPALARLEKRGLLRRTPHPIHGRVIQLWITEAGRQALRSASAVLATFEDALTGHLAATERKHLMAQLQDLRYRAEAWEREASR